MSVMTKMEAGTTPAMVRRLNDGSYSLRLMLPGRWAAMVQELARFAGVSVGELAGLIAEKWIEDREARSPRAS